MGKILCILILCGGSFNACAANLGDCDATRNLQAKFLKFDASNQSPHYIESIYLKYEEVWAIMLKFTKGSKHADNRLKQFACLVGLAAAADPWDGEGRTVGLLGDSLNDQKLKTVYETELARFPDQCRADLLRETVKARRCHDHLPQGASDEQEAQCEKYFADTDHFQECISKRT